MDLGGKVSKLMTKFEIKRYKAMVVAGIIIVSVIFLALLRYLIYNHCFGRTLGFCNNTEICIGWGKFCDGTEHCEDGSDEFNCPCGEDETSCKNGRCIMKNFFCDNVMDCPYGEDEDKCGSCEEKQFKCKIEKKCIEKVKVCDDVVDCAYGDDENNCYFMQYNMSVRNYTGELYAACADGWDDEWNHVVCTISLKIKSDSTEHSTIDFPNNYKMMKWKINSLKEYKIKKINNCSKALILQCQHDNGVTPCGMGETLQNFLVGGHRTQKDSLPWMAALIYKGVYLICGATIISETLLITTKQCVYSQGTDEKLITVLIGKYKLSDAKVLKVAKIHFFHNTSIDDGIAILQLSEPLNSNFVPICINMPDYNPNFYSVCVTIGFGDKIRERPKWLLYRRAKIINNTVCRRETEEIITEQDICFATGHYSRLDYSDYGAPLICQYNTNVWYLVGINVYFYRCKPATFFWKDEKCYISVALDLSYYRKWMIKIMEGKT